MVSPTALSAVGATSSRRFRLAEDAETKQPKATICVRCASIPKAGMTKGGTLPVLSGASDLSMLAKNVNRIYPPEYAYAIASTVDDVVIAVRFERHIKN
jgi:hypothetical protein